MEPTEFREANSVLTAPEGMPTVLDLPVWKGQNGNIVSLWRPSWRERLSLLIFGRVWLSFIASYTHPPVGVSARRAYFS